MSKLYRIASLKHTHNWNEHIVWWGLNHCGYTPVVGGYCGVYVQEQAMKLNSGRDYIAVPVEAVVQILSPIPYMHDGGVRAYDQVGPVVRKTRGNWNFLNLHRLDLGREVDDIKPEVCRKKDALFYGESFPQPS